jgi:hypothetical protein
MPSSGQTTSTGLRPVQNAERVVAALSDHVYRAARERALQDAIEIVLRGAGFVSSVSSGSTTATVPTQ